MSKSICTTIRQQLDEMELGEALSPEVSQHLDGCNDCQRFQQQQTSLRQIVGSLGTVNAPADFDFRLRARLANEKANNNLSSFANWSIFQKTAAVAAAVVILVAAVIWFGPLKNTTSEKQNIGAGVRKDNPSTPAPKASSGEQVVVKQDEIPTPQNKEAVRERSRRTFVASAPRPNRMLVAKDSASTGATVVKPATESVFPIDAAQQSLRVSLFDGRGNPRTISLPTVTFGSQKVVPTTTSFAPKGVW